MPFKIIRNDITKVKADAIVNTANPLPTIGSGTDSAIYKAAGKKQLLAEREKIGIMYLGQAASTPAFKLKAKYIIHTIGPVWEDGNHGERDILRDCYRNSLHLAAELSCKSIAFPLIATGVYGFPKDEALQIALAEINRFLLENDMRIILVVFDEKAFELSAKLMEDIEEYIDGEAAKAIRKAEYGMEEPYNRRNGRSAYLSASDPRMARRLEALELLNRRQRREPESAVVSAAVLPEQSLDDMLANTGDTFQQRLLQLDHRERIKEFGNLSQGEHQQAAVFQNHLRCELQAEEENGDFIGDCAGIGSSADEGSASQGGLCALGKQQVRFDHQLFYYA